MRALATLAAAAAVGGVLLTATASSAAIECPPGFRRQPRTIADTVTVSPCMPYVQCDPMACDPAVAE
jgi:hypothetical protein